MVVALLFGAFSLSSCLKEKEPKPLPPNLDTVFYWTTFPRTGDSVTTLAWGDQLLWIGTENNGLIAFDTLTETFTEQNVANRSWVRDLANHPDGGTWMATRDQGVWYFENGSWHDFDPQDTILPTDSINAIEFTPNGNLWVGTTQGLVKISPHGNVLLTTANSELPESHVRALLHRPRGLFIGTLTSGVALLDTGRWTVWDENLANNLAPHPANENIWNLSPGPSQGAWMGTGNGLFEWSGAGWIHHPVQSQFLPSNFTNAVLTTFSPKRHWFCTHNGVSMINRWRSTQQVWQTVNSPLPHNTVDAALEDEQGRIWLGTFNGIAILDPAAN